MIDLIYDQLHQSIDKAAILQRNWNSLDSDPPNAIACANARRVVDLTYGRTTFGTTRRILATAEGGIGLVFGGVHGQYADIECYNTGQILAVVSVRNWYGDPVVWSVGTGPENDLTIEQTLVKILKFIEGV